MRSLLENCEVSDRVGSCKENVRRNVRYLIELRAVRSLFGKMCRNLIELVVKENVRRNVRYLIELRAVRSLF